MSLSSPDALPHASSRFPLVGRERERHLLREQLDAMLGGHGRLVLVGGEAGIGKTTLVAWLVEQAREQGALVLTGHCYDLSTTPPYGPWLEITDRYQPDDNLPPLPDVLRRGTGVGNLSDQVALFEVVRDFFTSLARKRPLVLVLEDLHWSDPASLDLLRYLGRHLDQVPILPLATYRADEVTPSHPLYVLLPTLVREAQGERIDLRPLGDVDIASLIRSRYRLTQADAERLAGYLTRHTEGNPLYLREVLRTLEEQKVLCQEGDAWRLGVLSDVAVPSLIRQVILARAGRLDEQTRHLLAIAAVIGQEVPLDLWQMVTATDDDVLLGALEQAVTTHLLEESRDGSRIRFTHALIRETLYHSVLAARRRRWHRQIAEVLIASARPDPDVVAHHLQQAGDARAVDWLVQAGERAQRTYAWLTAAERFMAAERMLTTDDGRAGQRAWLLYRIGRLLRHSDQTQAVTYLERAVRQAEAVGDQVLAAYARFDLGHVRVMVGAYGQGLAEMAAGDAAISALGDAAFVRDDVVAWVADALPEESIPIRADAQTHPAPTISTRRGTLILFLNHPGRFQEAIELGEPYVAAASPMDRHGDLVLSSVGDTHLGLGEAYAAFGQPELAAEALDHAANTFRMIDHHFMIGATASTALRDVILPYYTTHIAERRRLTAEEESAFSRALGALPMGSLFRLGHLGVLLVEGSWREARAFAVDAHRALTKVSWRRPATVALGILARNQGDPELAWSLVHEVFGQRPATLPGNIVFMPAVQLQRLAVALALDSGDLPTAHAWLEAHDRWLGWSGVVRGRAEGALLWAQYHHATGDHQAAQSQASQALRYASDPQQPLALLAAHRFLGQLDTQAGQYADAEQHLQEALALADACVAPFERALTLLVLAELRTAMTKIEEARALAEEVRAICTPLDAKPTLDKVDTLLARLDAQPSATRYPAGLTSREVEVLRLVAQGMSDAEVAERLFISPRTVNTHLTSIYTKLAINSRTAATRFAIEQGLT